MSKIITNIRDPKTLERIAWHFNKKNILILSVEPVSNMDILPNITYAQLKESYVDSIKIIDHEFNKNKVDTAVIIPDLFGLYLYSYIAGFKKLSMIHICKNEKLEPVIVNPEKLGKPKLGILTYVKDHPKSDNKSIFKGIGYSEKSNSAYAHLKSLKNMELLKEEDKKYCITDLGSTILKLI